jgi:hypothetical protein
MRKIVLSHLARSRSLGALIACLVIAGFAQPASAGEVTSRLAGQQTTVKCRRVDPRHIQCTMTIRRGAAISRTVNMWITRGTLVVARGHGRIQSGKAALTMRVLHRMTPGQYTVTMLVTLTTSTVKLLH